MTKSFKNLSAAIDADPRRRAEVAAHTRAILDGLTLAALRESCGVTQGEVAEALAVSQSNVSRIEHQDDFYLSTLSSYVAALGGRLELTAVFPERTVSLVVSSAEQEVSTPSSVPVETPA
jgi:DNA-binding XRE family transcriptional regulator